MQFRILGPLEAIDDHRPLHLGGPKQRALLALLLLHRGEVVGSDRLIEELWGGRPPATAAKTLQVHVSHLRKALGSGTVVTCGHGYRLDVAPGDVDVDRFESLAGRGRAQLDAGDPSRAAETLSGALTLWRGPPLADLEAEEFARDEIARLQERRLEVIEQRIDAELAAGRHARVVADLEALARAHPLREGIHCRLMLALYRDGRQAEALAAYHRVRRGLRDEVGIEPGRELRELQRAMLTQEDQLEPGTVTAPLALERRRRRALVLVIAGGALLAVAVLAAVLELLDPGSGQLRSVGPRSLAAIDRSGGRLVAAIALPASPADMTVGAGAVWATLPDARGVARIDPRTRRVVRTVALRGAPSGIAAGSGAVWVADERSGTVARIDPALNAVGRPIDVGMHPSAVAAGPGAVWLASRRERQVVRLDVASGRLGPRIRLPDSPGAIAVGSGSVWVTSPAMASLVQLDARSGETQRIVRVGSRPAAVVPSEHFVWVANAADGTVSRVDQQTGTQAVVAVGAEPVALAVDGDELWVADAGDGTVSRVDTGAVRNGARISVGHRPRALAIASGTVFVGVEAARG
jgi:DNA-binding SARP family transcriptional activator/DNA-binding beta-propeller fold protein YncE